MARQLPLTCSGHTRPVVHLSFSDKTSYGYFLISACKGTVKTENYRSIWFDIVCIDTDRSIMSCVTDVILNFLYLITFCVFAGSEIYTRRRNVFLIEFLWLIDFCQ